MQVIIVAPSLNPSQNVSGVSAVTQFIIDNNREQEYFHFELGKKDNEKGGIYRIVDIIKALFEWKTLLSRHNDAIIHYNFPLSTASILRDFLFIEIAGFKKRKVVLHIHGGNYLAATYTPKILKLILIRIFKKNYSVIVLSDLEKELLIDKYHCKKIYSLPNCVDLTVASTVNKSGLSNKTPLVLSYLGRIAETKGMRYLLDACNILKQKQVPFILKIAGKEEVKDQYLPLFQQSLNEQFIYSGVVSGKEKYNFLKEADIFILPSFFEGLPMSLLECMSFGVVPVTTNVGSICKVVHNLENGCFIKKKNTESIVETIEYLFTHREILEKMSIEARKSIFKEFNPEIYIDKLNEIYSY